jgi:hypothetical protein
MADTIASSATDSAFGLGDLVNATKNVALNLGAQVQATNTLATALSAFSSGTFTCTSSASTVVTDSSVKGTSKIVLQPTNAAAGTLQGSAKCLYVSAIGTGSFTVTTASSTPTGSETFSYIRVG